MTECRNRSLHLAVTTVAAIVVLVGLTVAVARLSPAYPQAPGEILDRTELHVCADPNNLPFSNEKGEGFENRIAQVIGDELKLPVSYVFFPQVIGFVRNTLRARTCDLIMGTAAGDDIVQTTSPYYYSTYVAVYLRNKDFQFTDFNDPRLKTMRIGIISATPPSDLLIRHDLMENAKPYALMVDTRYDSPTREMVDDIQSGAVDIGLLWGPIAGYYAKEAKQPLAMVPVPNEEGAPRMDYHIAMGVRNNEPEWRRHINAAIAKRHSELTAILRDYGVPLLDEQGRLTSAP
ncbi:MAG TPA: substrate-binding domain-containing protein [Stellaceae bacterium]|jgi:quinoprotein dehydrogenase-associated probable ABC transporter substrate-binding protein|nr:substrate-binding domain-containing protein [Stellaceae bacterium]